MSSVPATPPLAIIGIGCLFPGSSDFAGFWSRIVQRHDAIREVPASHWRPSDYLNSDPRTPDHVYSARGGFLDPVAFNPVAFGIPPSNLEATDASQLLGLVVAQQALEDCGYSITSADKLPGAGPKAIDRSRISVILGVTGTLQLVIPLGARLGHPLWRKALADAGVSADVAEDVVQRIGDGYVGWQENSFPGLLGNVVAGRIANRFDLGGTNCVVDAACASSLGAVHLAAMELAAGRADVVLTGGVDTFNDIFMFTCFSKTPALSPTGNAKPFDANGDGTALGEGLGMVVLKRLADAQRDGDRIYAVLRGIGSSSDGKGNAIYAPRKEGQIDALRNAYRIAGVLPDTIELVEGHGTGTKVGDATEVSALTEVFRQDGQNRQGRWCAIGSIKSQMGHTKAAAGVAGLIKAAAALYHKVLPPTIKVQEPLEVLQAPDCPLYVNTQSRPWMPTSHPRRAAVSAFGFGGSNFHAVLEEADSNKQEIGWVSDVQILAFCGPSADDLRQQIERFPLGLARTELCRHAAELRQRFRPDAQARLLIVFEGDLGTLSDLLKIAGSAISSGKSDPAKGIFFGTGTSAGKLGVLFPGQGSQSVGMLRDLICHFPAAFDVFTQANSTFQQATTRALVDLVYPPSSFKPEERKAQEEALRATDVAQPALGAVSLGAWRVLESFGVRGDAFAGHSYGELPALCAAGWLSETDLHRLSLQRGRLMAEAGKVEGETGTMLAVKAGEEAILRVVKSAGLQDHVVLANKNSPNQTVLSGPTSIIGKAHEAFQREKISAVRLPVAAAFHSPLVANAEKPFYEAIDFVIHPRDTAVYSNTLAQRYPQDQNKARELLSSQLARPVEWVRQIQGMSREGITTFIEVGPGGKLSPLVSAILGNSENVFALDSTGGQRNGFLDLAHLLGWLASRGYRVELNKWAPIDPTKKLPPRGPGIVELTGANYVRPRPERPKVERPAHKVSAPSPAAVPTPPLAPAPVIAVPASQASVRTVEAAPAFAPNRNEPAKLPTAPRSGSVNSMMSPQPDPNALLRALEITRDSMAALQKMQEQTAQLHRQYLDGQDHAHRTVHLLVEQQQRLLQVGLGVPGTAFPAPPALSQPTPVSAPQPVRVEPTVPAPPVRLDKPASAPPPPVRPVAQAPVSAPTPPVVVATKPVGEAKPASAPKTNADVDRVLLEVIAEKTGYPVEMLQLEMTLDADLGIDSIKRVEILSALQDRLPHAPTVKPEHLGTLHSLRDIANFLGANGGDATESGASPASANSGRIEQVLLEVIAEKTGYPVEMLQLEMTLDADLGIDSIKRVEILSALQDRLPHAPTVKPEHLGTLHSLRDISSFLGQGTAPTPTPVIPVVPVAPTPVVPPQPKVVLERSIVQPVPLSTTLREEIRIGGGAEVWITTDDVPLAGAIGDLLAERGYRVRRHRCAELARLQGTPAIVLLLAPPGEVRDTFLFDALMTVKQAGPSLKKQHGVVVTVSHLDGAFGLSGGPLRREPIDGGLAGLTKTVAQEWKEVHAKALDVAGTLDTTAAAQAVVEELFLKGPVEVGIGSGSRCTIQRVVAAVTPSEEPTLIAGDVVIVSGGARGVTAEVAVALAQTYKPKLVLIGRSPEPQPEPDWMMALKDEAALKQELVRRRAGVQPRVLNEEVKAIQAAREIRANLERIRQAGTTAIYRSVDIRDEKAVATLLRQLRQEFGPLRGIIHGAGVLADARIEDKTAEQFNAVYQTKVEGLRNLLRGCQPDELKSLVLFSSSTARFGRTGQVDYAIANEVLNKTAWYERYRRPTCLVRSLNWGPWDGGMVTSGLKQLFAAEGVGVIPLQAGAQLVVEELRGGDHGDCEVVVLAPGKEPVQPPVSAPVANGHHLPPALPPAFERSLDVHDFPVLASHVLDGRPVVPVALLLEWLSHAALMQNPGLLFHGCDDLRVIQGVILDEVPLQLRVGSGKAIRRDGFFIAPTEIRSLRKDGKEVLHARADIVLVNSLPTAPQPNPAPLVDSYPIETAELYRQGMLFHGPALQGLEQIQGCGEAGMIATVASAPAANSWLRHPYRQHWLADPMVLDGSFQMMVLWTQEQRSGPSLPCHIRRYRQYRRAFPGTSVQVLAWIERASDLHVITDMDYVDRDGRLIARLEGYEGVIDPGLTRAFSRNVLVNA